VRDIEEEIDVENVPEPLYSMIQLTGYPSDTHKLVVLQTKFLLEKDCVEI
jgi:hypothetical protein